MSSGTRGQKEIAFQHIMTLFSIVSRGSIIMKALNNANSDDLITIENFEIMGLNYVTANTLRSSPQQR